MANASYRSKMFEAFRSKVYIFSFGVSAVFFLILIQIFNLQVIQGDSYKQKARINMEVNVPISAPRGEIYDRSYIPGVDNHTLVSNRASFNITIIPADFKKKDEMENVLRDLSGLIELNIEDTLKEIKNENPWQRFILKEDVDFEVIVKIASHQEKFSKLMWENVPVRVYNFKNMFAHTIGYIGSMNPNEYKRLKKKNYKKYQKIGKTGLESQYDEILRGTDGYVRRIVDVKNRTEGEEVGLPPVAGKNLVLAIDYNLQKRAYNAFENLHGSAVVIKPSTGEILTMVSKPDFDPNDIISKNNNKKIIELQNNKDKPFLNRAIQSKYPPASTFKLVTAIAGLEEEKWKAHWTNYCPGYYILKGFKDKKFYCYDTHGSVNLYTAIGKSCSVYFYNLGYKIGPTVILKYAHEFGLDDKTNIDLPGETSSFLPSKSWKRKAFGQPWFDGDTINLAIGQGFTSVTSMGLVSFLCGVVNDGVINKPFLVKEVRSQDGTVVISKTRSEKLREVPLSPYTLDSVRYGMRLTVKIGTARRLNYLKVPIAGKTGTAQTRSIRLEKKSQHAWFLGYAPFDGDKDKAVAVVIMVEYGIAGAATAVPVAEQIFDELINLGYFK